MPVVILNVIELDSLTEPAAMVEAVAVLFDMLTTSVPVAVNPVDVDILQTLPEFSSVIFPVPNANVLVFELLLPKDPAVNVLLFRSNVPFVRVTCLVDPSVKAS